MALSKINPLLERKLAELRTLGTSKREERVVVGLTPPAHGFGPRYLLAGQGQKEFLRMNANSYLGLSLHPAVIEAEERACRAFGTGPGAVRFISGTFAPHLELEKKLAAFHGREAALTMSAAYATVMGVLPQLITDNTLVISDALNHNCIINGVRLARPKAKAIYPHLDIKELEAILLDFKGKVDRVLVVTDGIFSMRGDHAPLAELVAVCAAYEDEYPEGIITVVDDSHGIGALGATGRGTEEKTGARADILIATLGKALGVNGGYVAADRTVISYLRESAPFYIYSNPITPGEAAAAAKALDILDSDQGLKLLAKLRELTNLFARGLVELGYEIIEGDHPIVPVLIRDTGQTARLVSFLFEQLILATGINYPVVPKGEEEVRFQISAAHTEQDINLALQKMALFKKIG
ncbi:MAG: aminotransferase class I/II-fold pyridoxal phosphate-dependent enzyme [Desulfobulbaceae bacterium]|nr:aminotransferase class I/II-fold pyridoxal phosphate-dependent enzyme [Desulfobulbaceae bacterium]HIJ78784.1 aminotransferase class I/II-fold pyridoxal phosphate-dependent enzyme [Deltaproteobacteria bacterium]